MAVVEAQTPHQRLRVILLLIHMVVQVVVVEEVLLLVPVDHMVTTVQLVHLQKAVAAVVALAVLEDHLIQDQEVMVLQTL